MSGVEEELPQTGGVAAILEDYPGVDKHSCQLLGPTALIVQGLMGVLVILSLVYKRHREHSKRPWRIWLFDVSKQVIGQMFVHGVNVLASGLVARNSDENACVFYFFNILVDTTLGVALLYVILSVLTYLCTEKLLLEGFESGVYGKPPSLVYWVKQAILYVVALTTMKLLVLALLAVFPGLFMIGTWLLSWTQTGDNDALQVIFTMGLFPIIMNILQFWLIDSIVKASESTPVSLDTDAHDGLDREPLFGVDEDDDNIVGPQRHDIENPRPRSSSNTTPGTITPVGIERHKSSGSMTPAATDHSYPPSLSSSASSASSMSNLKKKKTPPAPLHLKQHSQPVVNSPAPVSALAPRPAEAEDWDDSWGDNDDWADRVGEEDWTGRRLEEKKENVNGVWDVHPSQVQIHG